METTRRINIAIDEALHRKLKIQAAVRGETVREYVCKSIQKRIDEEKKGTDKV